MQSAITIKTPYGTAYAETLSEAQSILDASIADREHEACEHCRGYLDRAECETVRAGGAR